MSRRGICHTWFRGRHISPSMPYREARSVAESSEGPTASQMRLYGRRQRVTVLSETSRDLPVTSGVPQGSILRPALFLLYVNNLPDSILNSKVAMFADDTKVYKVMISEDDGAALQQDLDNLSSWSVASGLAFNDKKCKFQTITRKRKPICTSYEVNGNTIMSCEEERDLGVSLERDLTWHA